jgi:predicted aconitase
MPTHQDLHLTQEERAMLAGDQGRAVQRAIEIVVALAKIYGATHLVPVASVQVAGVSYKNLGQAGLDFLREWADQGARVRVPTTLNPAGLDLQQWQALGFSEEFYDRQRAVIDAYTAMGIAPTCTCTPYWVGNRPRQGQHLAWAESSAVSLANSVLGARTNREGGPSALAAALCGRTAAYGLHLDANRAPTLRIDVACPLETLADWSALGYLAGRQARDGVPYFVLHDPSTLQLGHSALSAAHSAAISATTSVIARSALCDKAIPTDVIGSDEESPSPQQPTSPLADPALLDRLKTLGAAMAASGAVALYHIAGLTPEARTAPPPAGIPQIAIDDLAPAYAALNQGALNQGALNQPPGGGPEIDLVSIGCPHASPAEIAAVARAVAGRRLRAQLWVTTARATRARVPDHVATIEAAGGRVVADTCLVVAPVRELGFRTMATNSAKMAAYTPSHSGLQVRFGPLEQCIQAALTGRWETP